MKLTRRNFLALAGLSAVGAVACEGFGIREGEFSLQSPVSLPEDLVRGTDNWYATLCRTCPSSEGIVVRVMEGRAKKIQGNPLYPTNQGKQSARCEAGLQALYHPERVAGPMRRSGGRGLGQFEILDPDPEKAWDIALDIFKEQLQKNGDNMLMVTEPLRGHMAKVVDRFAEAMGGRNLAFEGMDNIAYRAAVKNVFQQDSLPDFDLANTNFLLSFGADFLSTWVSPTRWNVGYGEFRQGEGRPRGTFYQVDPRFSTTAASADQWVPVTPGWEGYLALSLAYVIISEGLQAPNVDLAALTDGRGKELLEPFRPEVVGARIGLPDHLRGETPTQFIEGLAREFAGHRPSLAIGGGSAGAHTNGLFNLEAIYALNYLVGSVGAEGGIRFNPAPPIGDLPASANVASLSDWISAAEDLNDGRTKLVVLHQADPAYGLPGSLNFRDALNRDDLFIVSLSPFIDDTSALADLILPDRMGLEDWGSDIPEPGPGYQTLGVQQPVVNPLSDLNPRSSADVLIAMAGELGKQTEFPDGFKAMLEETSQKLFELNRGSIKKGDKKHDDGEPDDVIETAQDFWNALLRQGGWWDEDSKSAAPASPPKGLFNSIAEKASEPRYPGLVPGRNIFHLVPFSHISLLDGQNAHLPWLQAVPDPLTTVAWQTWLEINDGDAQRMGLREGDIVQVSSTASSSIRVPVYPHPAVPPQVVSIPLGQGRRDGPEAATGRPASESSNVMDIIEPSKVEGTDALAWANTTVTITPTGNSIKVSKFEGIVRAVEVGNTEAERIIITVTPDGH